MGARAVTIIRTGTANVASVTAAFERLGLQVDFTDDPGEVGRASFVVLPGVGSFAAGMERLVATGIDRALVRRVSDGQPTLGICLGMQLFARSSDESPGVAGLGVLNANVSAFDASVSVPQLGWNRIEADAGCRVLRSGMVYYANSYKFDAVPDGWNGARTTHGDRFVGAIERGPVVLCQFHPELSGPFGAGILNRWIELAEGVPC